MCVIKAFYEERKLLPNTTVLSNESPVLVAMIVRYSIWIIRSVRIRVLICLPSTSSFDRNSPEPEEV
jgi:hypothetical protein